MTNYKNTMTTDIQIAGNTHDEAQSFKYFGAIISEEDSKSKGLARIAQVTAALFVKSVHSLERPQHHSQNKDPPDAFSRCCCLTTSLLVEGVRSSRPMSTSHLLCPSGQQFRHSSGVCSQIQG